MTWRTSRNIADSAIVISTAKNVDADRQHLAVVDFDPAVLDLRRRPLVHDDRGVPAVEDRRHRQQVEHREDQADVAEQEEQRPQVVADEVAALVDDARRANAAGSDRPAIPPWARRR